MKTVTLTAGTLLTGLLIMTACSNNQLADYNPEVTNAPDNFQLQATNISDVTETLEYAWSNSAAIANIDQSCAITGGEAQLTLIGPNGTQVYTRSLTENGSFVSDTGSAGNWTIKLELTNTDGTINFRVQKHQ